MQSEIVDADKIVKRYNQISAVLVSGLNWQEALVISHSRDLDCGNLKTVNDVGRVAFAKKTFLEDALIYSLRDALCHINPEGKHKADRPIEDADFTFTKAIWPLLKNNEMYFFALAFAKLFRARMSTRCRHEHGLPWNSKFAYQRCPTTYGHVLPREWRRSAKQLAGDRRDCFIEPPANGKKPAAKLAVLLRRSARDFFNFYYEALKDDQKDVLRKAVLERDYDYAGLLDIWTEGCGSEYNLPMDTFWTRAATVKCVYAENCIGYDEFAAFLTHAQHSHADGGDSRTSQEAQCLQLAREKVARLQEAEGESEWPKVARNWWCQGFVRGVYSWGNDFKINGKNARITLEKDAQAVVNLIRNVDLYKKVKESIDVQTVVDKKVKEAVRELDKTVKEAVRELDKKVKEDIAVQKLFIPMIREACEGAMPEDIKETMRIGNLGAVWSFLFLVATTQRAPKLQDCWTRAAGAADDVAGSSASSMRPGHA